jgi:hypothetical protein
MASIETEWIREIEIVSDEPLIMKIILLIEDDSIVALRLGEMFAQKTGYQVIVASNCPRIAQRDVASSEPA